MDQGTLALEKRGLKGSTHVFTDGIRPRGWRESPKSSQLQAEDALELGSQDAQPSVTIATVLNMGICSSAFCVTSWTTLLWNQDSYYFPIFQTRNPRPSS
jgi:hypothetical protein